MVLKKSKGSEVTGTLLLGIALAVLLAIIVALVLITGNNIFTPILNMISLKLGSLGG